MSVRQPSENIGEATDDHHHVMVNYDILIQRKPIYYLLTCLLPCFIITSITIVGIFSPFNDSGGREEKVSMGQAFMLTMTVILKYITDKMPKSSEGLPLLGIEIICRHQN